MSGRAHSSARQRTAAGFTVVELVVTMTISVIVVAFSALFISTPVQGFIDQSRRGQLVDQANAALDRVARDIRRALPNSVRTRLSGGIAAVELLGTVDGARYREQPPGGPARVLDFAAADGSFNVIGRFDRISKPFSSTTHFLSIYNVGVPGADAYELTNVITPAGTQIDIAADSFGSEDRVSLSPPVRFSYGSPSRRIFLVDGVVTYLCDPTTGLLRRYSGYDIALNQSARDSHAELMAAGASVAVLADLVSSCRFDYAPGTAERAGLVTLELDLSDQGETVTLLTQVHVDNAP